MPLVVWLGDGILVWLAVPLVDLRPVPGGWLAKLVPFVVLQQEGVFLSEEIFKILDEVFVHL